MPEVAVAIEKAARGPPVPVKAARQVKAAGVAKAGPMATPIKPLPNTAAEPRRDQEGAAVATAKAARLKAALVKSKPPESIVTIELGLVPKLLSCLTLAK